MLLAFINDLFFLPFFSLSSTGKPGPGKQICWAYPLHLSSTHEKCDYSLLLLFLLGNNKYNQDAMDATFLLSNIVPQDLDNNANFWFRLEAYCRSLTKRYSNVYIVSGPLYLPKEQDGKKIVTYEVRIYDFYCYNLKTA